MCLYWLPILPARLARLQWSVETAAARLAWRCCRGSPARLPLGAGERAQGIVMSRSPAALVVLAAPSPVGGWRATRIGGREAFVGRTRATWPTPAACWNPVCCRGRRRDPVPDAVETSPAPTRPAGWCLGATCGCASSWRTCAAGGGLRAHPASGQRGLAPAGQGAICRLRQRHGWRCRGAWTPGRARRRPEVPIRCCCGPAASSTGAAARCPRREEAAIATRRWTGWACSTPASRAGHRIAPARPSPVSVVRRAPTARRS